MLGPLYVKAILTCICLIAPLRLTSSTPEGVGSCLNYLEAAVDPVLSWVAVSLIQVRERNESREIGIMSKTGPAPPLG